MSLVAIKLISSYWRRAPNAHCFSPSLSQTLTRIKQKKPPFSRGQNNYNEDNNNKDSNNEDNNNNNNNEDNNCRLPSFSHIHFHQTFWSKRFLVFMDFFYKTSFESFLFKCLKRQFQFWVGPFNQLKWRNNPLNPICLIISEIALFVNRSITETIRDMGLFIQLRINRSVCVHKK